MPITTRKKNLIFVFGSNEAGLHGGGAALVAAKQHDMPYGKSYGHYGSAFGIPTKCERIETLGLNIINVYVQGFLAFARGRPKMEFMVTQIGCGLAGLNAADIAPMFVEAPDNCWFDQAWEPYLEPYRPRSYWGTFP